MSNAIKTQITKELGVDPVLINSSLVSAQSRQRLYWVGYRDPITGHYHTVPVALPADRGILLRDILETGVAWREKAYTLKGNYGHGVIAQQAVDGGHYPAPAVAEPVRIGTIESGTQTAHDSKPFRVYSPDGKAVTIQGEAGGYGAKTGLYAVPSGMAWRGHARNGNSSSFEMRGDQKANAVIVGHQNRLVIESVPMRIQEATKQGYVDIAPGECVDLAMEHSKTRRGRRMAEKSNCLTTTCSFYEYCGTSDKPIYQVKDGYITIKGKRYPIKLRDGYYIIRKLTVLECMRLQTVPETYIFPVSPTQAYKMLGNGWTVDVIAHIMSHFRGITTEPVEVLSMYDGMSCGHIALDKLGANVVRYYATEIDKYAIQTTLANYPDTVQLGDAFQVRWDGWPLREEETQ